MTPNITQEQAFTALRTFLLGVVPAGTEVVQLQTNRVPMPSSENWIGMAVEHRRQMAQTVTEYDRDAGESEIARSTSLHFQIDVYGAGAGDTAQVITTLLRDSYGTEALAPSGLAPLYCEDPFQLPLVAGEQQFIQRWTVRCALHGNISVSVPAEFAATLVTVLQEVT